MSWEVYLSSSTVYQPSEFMGWFLWYEDDWLEAEYAHTAASVTPEIREAFDGCRR